MSRQARWTAAFVALCALVAHAPGVLGGFVFDDHRFVEQNADLDRLDPLAYLRDPSTASADAGIQHDVYRPLRTLDYALTAAVFGRTRAWAFHVGNVLLHVLTSLLVLRLIWPLVRGRAVAAALATALFAVHPATVEVVAWISSRGDLLALLLMLGSLIVLERTGTWRGLLGLGLAGLALLAKESALVLPALLVLRDLALPADRRPALRVTAFRTAALAGVVLLYLALRLSVLPALGQVAEFPGGSRLAALRGMLGGVTWYATALLWPSGFPFDVHLAVPGHFSDPEVVVGAGLLGTTLLAGLWGVRRRSVLAFAALGALACLVPVSNVFVPLKALVAERFLYPVLACLVVGVAGGLAGVGARLRRGVAAAAALVVVLLVPLTWARTRGWADDLTLWETVLRERPSHMRAYEGLGYEYLRRGRILEAEIAYKSYLDYNPADGKAMVLLGDAFGEVAGALRIRRPEPGVTTDVSRRRHEARVAQLLLYHNALRTWARIGLLPGRGSPELLLHVHAARLEAAIDMGDLAEARDANNALLRLEGIDPADVQGVFSHASAPRRRARLYLALTALSMPVPRDLPRELYDQRNAQRADALRDVGLDPRQSDDVGAAALLPRYRELAESAEAVLADAMNLALLLEQTGDLEEAERVRRAARSRWPDDPYWRGAP